MFSCEYCEIFKNTVYYFEEHGLLTLQDSDISEALEEAKIVDGTVDEEDKSLQLETISIFWARRITQEKST